MKNLTFITAIKIESEDRLRNLNSVLGYLNKRFPAKMIIAESGKKKLGKSFFDRFPNMDISYIGYDDDVFHRTRYLNDCLKYVDTELVSNYDIDVILPERNTYEAIGRLNCGADFVYPYPHGWGQIQVHQGYNREKFHESSNDLDLLEEAQSPFLSKFTTYCGHAFFAKTDSYRRAGGENENFVSYGPEDQERILRFEKLGFRIERCEEGHVYHFEHGRSPDSTAENPYFQNNFQEFERIKAMSKEEILMRVPPIE